MPDAAVPVTEVDDDFRDLLDTCDSRVKRIREMRAFDGELARREFRDEIYPALKSLVGIVAEIDGRLGAVEDGATGDEVDLGVPAELADDLVRALVAAAALVGVMGRVLPLLQGIAAADLATIREASAFLSANGERLATEVRELRVEVEPDGVDGGEE